MFTHQAKGQFGDAGEVLRAGAADAELLLTEYLKPAAIGFSTSLNTGWFNTAGTHGLLGFGLTVRGNIAAMPSNLNQFNFGDLSLDKTRLAPGQTPTVSTIIGPDDPTRIQVWDTFQNPISGQQEEVVLAEFDIPGGIDFGYVPSAMIQLSVGVIKNTDLTLRYMPSVRVPALDTQIDLIGFGFKHDIKQWIPGMSLMPVDISFAAGYTRFTAVADAEVRPGNPTTPGAQPMSQWEDQEISFSADGWNANVLVGRRLPVVSVYAGIGYESSSTTLKALGNYPVESLNTTTGTPQIESITDPINIGIDGTNSVRGLAGARFRLLIFTLSADFVVADVSSASIGLGISFR